MEIENFEVCNFFHNMKYIDEAIHDLEQRLADFKKLERNLSLFTHALTIVITIKNTDYQLGVCDFPIRPLL